MSNEELIESISTLIDIQCAKQKTNKSNLSLKMNRNPRYLSNMFNKNKNSIDVLVLCEIAKQLECEPSELIPNLDSLKSLN